MLHLFPSRYGDWNVAEPGDAELFHLNGQLEQIIQAKPDRVSDDDSPRHTRGKMGDNAARQHNQATYLTHLSHWVLALWTLSPQT